MGKDSSIGTVIHNTGATYLVRLDPDKCSDDTVVSCRIKGNFRIKGIRTTNPIAVGDRVEVALGENDAHYIVSILPRKNYIIRRASNLSKESHILAANIDRAVLVSSLINPTTPTTFIDRFLATAEAYNIPAMIVLNKSDLWNEKERELAGAIAYLYDSIGYPTIIVSALTGEGIDKLRKAVESGISLFAGNSGVGKSSLINCLAPEANLRTGAVSDIHHTGTHTTTFSQMIDLPTGGSLIDIPGVKGFGVIDFEPMEVSHFFPEIFKKGLECRYSDCLHNGGKGCAVIPAVENAEIAQSRYASYLSILEEASEADKYRQGKGV